jgi:hypothetical protein
MKTRFVQRFRSDWRVRLSVSILSVVALLLLTPALEPGGSFGARNALASGCGAYAQTPYYSGAYAYGYGSISCDGSTNFQIYVCLRKQHSFQPDEDTTCVSRSGIYYSYSMTAAQCGAHNNYRTKTEWAPLWYAGGGYSQSSWAYMNANC